MTPTTISRLEAQYPFGMTRDEIIEEFKLSSTEYKKWIGNKKFLTIDRVNKLIGDKI